MAARIATTAAVLFEVALGTEELCQFVTVVQNVRFFRTAVVLLVKQCYRLHTMRNSSLLGNADLLKSCATAQISWGVKR